jgi:hypothetical protein
MAGDAKPYRKWFKVGIGVAIAWSLLSLVSWHYGPVADEDAIAVRLFLTAIGFMGIVACVIGLLVTSW